ncbi:MAG: ABC transporter substrate-binding protein [Candidatus Omnitrophica bacterium]|nr:ABC transporter substrate-binding protein [Candidatus Omnitrophota bacterium]
MTRFFIFIFSLLFLIAPVHAQERVPSRIISLGPVITQELYLLGSEDRIVGVTAYCQRPEAAKLKERVGNVQEINLEKVVALKPDIVFATVLTDPRAKTKLRNLGINVIDIPNARDFNEVCDVFLMIGKIVGKDQAARVIIAQAKAEVAALKEKVSRSPWLSVFVQVGANPLVTIGRGSFVNDLIELAGGVNIVEGAGYLQYSKEKIVMSDPDVLLISSMGFDGEREKKNWQKLGVLKAARQEKIFIIDEYLLCSPTPLSFADALKSIMKHLHPEVVL